MICPVCGERARVLTTYKDEPGLQCPACLRARIQPARKDPWFGLKLLCALLVLAGMFARRGALCLQFVEQQEQRLAELSTGKLRVIA